MKFKVKINGTAAMKLDGESLSVELLLHKRTKNHLKVHGIKTQVLQNTSHEIKGFPTLDINVMWPKLHCKLSRKSLHEYAQWTNKKSAGSGICTRL